MTFRRKSWARRFERCCCTTLSYFPLTFVYGLTTWAVYVEVSVSFLSPTSAAWWACTKAALGVLLWAIANVSYTIAVFTSPGSPLDVRQDWSNRRGVGGGYEGLPTYEVQDREQTPHGGMTTVTAKSSDGKPRYCKKCNTVKPDRAHHCSTCGQCVLKMDHHCPWLATCVGLRNYKPFLLFLIYTSVFCWLCFAVSAVWVWHALSESQQFQEGLRVVNAILLAVLGGIIGLVLSGFTGWHIYLAVTGQTTIESLEKTRYLSPLRKHMEPNQFRSSERHYLSGRDEEDGNGPEQEQSLLDHLKETHANALPGVLRPEEGEEPHSGSHTPIPYPVQSNHSSPAKTSLQRNLECEYLRERDRYAAYLDEKDSERLPNAFDVGWKRNLLHVFGNRPLLWFLPVCNTSGDGWMWDVSPKWTEERARIQRERDARTREESMWERESSFQPPPRPRDLRWAPGQGFVEQSRGFEGQGWQMQPLDRRKAPAMPNGSSGNHDDVDAYDTSSDEDSQRRGHANGAPGTMANWNDVPDDFLTTKAGSRSRSRGRQKGD